MSLDPSCCFTDTLSDVLSDTLSDVFSRGPIESGRLSLPQLLSSVYQIQTKTLNATGKIASLLPLVIIRQSDWLVVRMESD